MTKLLHENPAVAKMPTESVSQFVNFLYGGLLSQLRSMPVGLRVDEWILSEFPDLSSLQKQAVMRQLEDNVAGLRPDIRKLMPERNLNLNLSMNAAFALFWSTKLNEPQLTLPYKVSGHLEVGERLVKIWQSAPRNPEADRSLIDAWADHLGVSGWYKWVPYSVNT